MEYRHLCNNLRKIKVSLRHNLVSTLRRAQERPQVGVYFYLATTILINMPNLDRVTQISCGLKTQIKMRKVGCKE